MLIKKKIAFLFDKKNPWLLHYLPLLKKLPKKKYKHSFFKDYVKISNFEIVFVLGFTKILSESFIKKNRIVLIIHESNLPKFKGFAPVQWQILRNKRNITNSLVMLGNKEKVDSGKIILQNKILLKGHELYEEIRKKQFDSTYKLIRKFLHIYPNFTIRRQKGKSTFFRKRNSEDSKISINKNIKSQFNLLRISNNNGWPAFFLYKKNKYILKIFKSNEIN
jgi:methionyl-tRNA formyltransferase